MKTGFIQLNPAFPESRNIGFAILDIENLTTDLDSATPKTCVRTISSSFELLKILTAILDPPFWISKIWHQIWIQRPQKPMYSHFHQYSLETKWSFHTPIFSQNFQVKNYHFENDNDFYDENQKYTVKQHDFCTPMVEESVKYSRDFNVKKKSWE